MAILFTMRARITDFESPNFVGATGMRVHFDLNIRPGDFVRDTGGSLMLFNYRRTTGYIRSDGNMYNREATSAAPYDLTDPGELGVRLPASDPALLLDPGLTYRVTLEHIWRGRHETIRSFDTPVVPATDTIVHLANAAPDPRLLEPSAEPGGPIVGTELPPGALLLTHGRDFDWSCTNRDSTGAPTAFPPGALFLELATTPITTWDFTIAGNTASVHVESTALAAIAEGTPWQLVFLPAGEDAGGYPLALGVVRFQG